MSIVYDDRWDGIDAEIEREERLAEKYFEQYQDTGSLSTEKTAEKHARIAEVLRKGLNADKHDYNRAMIAVYVMEINTQDLIKCGQQVKRLQKRISEGEFS